MMTARQAFQGVSTELQDGNILFPSLRLKSGEVVSLNDFVLVSALDDINGEPPYVAKVLRMWHNAVILWTLRASDERALKLLIDHVQIWTLFIYSYIS